MKLVCACCGVVFVRWHTGYAGRRVFCSPRCRNRYHQRIWRLARKVAR